MIAPFIEHIPQRLYFVPVLRQRLTFAVLVQRAMRELTPWTRQDLIAVALPPSVLTAVRSAVQVRAGVLPVSLVLADWGDTEYREVFPITGCDGIIEAVRLAVDRDLPVEAIDREIKAGNLIGRRCLDDPEWPDDELAIEWGPVRYLELIADRLVQPPTRFEPIDTWRETCMADRLKALQPRFRRVLVVCEAVHIAAIRRQLNSPSRQLDITPEPLQKPKLRVVGASPETMLRYLDDFPRLAESYENARRDGRAADFSKFA
jgi:hypothetical protein